MGLIIFVVVMWRLLKAATQPAVQSAQTRVTDWRENTPAGIRVSRATGWMARGPSWWRAFKAMWLRYWRQAAIDVDEWRRPESDRRAEADQETGKAEPEGEPEGEPEAEPQPKPRPEPQKPEPESANPDPDREPETEIPEIPQRHLTVVPALPIERNETVEILSIPGLARIAADIHAALGAERETVPADVQRLNAIAAQARSAAEASTALLDNDVAAAAAYQALAETLAHLAGLRQLQAAAYDAAYSAAANAMRQVKRHEPVAEAVGAAAGTASSNTSAYKAE